MMINLFYGLQIISSPNQSEVLIMDPGDRNPDEYSNLFFQKKKEDPFVPED